MKPKKIPRVVRIWLMLMGYWVGTIATMVLMAFGLTGSALGYIFLGGSYGASLVLFFVIGWRQKKTLIEWGLVDPDKKKEKEQ